VLAGVLALHSLPVGQFPAIAPPAVTITATYPGADAETLDATTTQIIERQMKGIDGLRYFSSSSSSAGTVTITLTFEQGTDPDIAQVQVQNKLQQATPLLPQEVQKQGLCSPSFSRLARLARRSLSRRRIGLHDGRNRHQVQLVVNIGGRRQRVYRLVAILPHVGAERHLSSDARS
jgi:Cu/Ag efflux pump CusA